MEAAYGLNAISRSQVFNFFLLVKDGKDTSDKRAQNPKKTKATAENIEAVRVIVDKDHRVGIREIGGVLGLSFGTISNIFHDDLLLTKKAARRVPKLLSKEQKDVWCGVEFRKAFFKDK